MIMPPAKLKRFQEGGSAEPYVAGVTRQERQMDPIVQQLLFGLGGQGGFIPGAMRAAERTFFDEQGRPIVINQRIAGFSPDQLLGMQLARQNIGAQTPFLRQAQRQFEGGLGAIRQGARAQLGSQEQALRELRGGAAEERFQRSRGLQSGLRGLEQEGALSRRAFDQFGRDLGGATGQLQSAVGRLNRGLSGAERRQLGATQEFGGRLGESERLLRGTTGAFDPSMTQQFYDPYEERVVQQAIQDITKGAAQTDMAQRARDIQSAGESAFGSRARLTAGERAEALGRGLLKEIGGLRSAGFQRAQQAAMGEFARQRDAERAAASGLAGLSGQRLGAQERAAQMLGSGAQTRFGAGQALAGQLGSAAQQMYGAGTQLGQTMGQLGQRAMQARMGAGQAGLGTAGQLAQGYGQLGGVQGQYGQQVGQAMQGYGQQLQGLGNQFSQAGQQDVQSLMGIGGQQQALRQREYDAQRAGLLQAQQAPLAQYQQLLPFMQFAAGQTGPSGVTTQYTPPPSPLQAGLGTGLSALGALGNFFTNPQGTNTYPYQQPQQQPQQVGG